MREAVGVIGLGAMGLPMARNLVDAGFDVHGFDLSAEACDTLRRSGGIVASGVADLAERCPIVVVVVVDAAQFEAAIFARGALAHLRQGSVIVSCVTMAPQSVDDFAARLSARGVALVDAPVSGGVKRARSGTLAVFAAGAHDSLRRVDRVLNTIGAHVFRVGEEPGQGSSVKIVNQLLCGVHLAATAEAIAFAERIGVDAKLLYEIVTMSSGSSRMFESRAPAMIEPTAEVNSAAGLFIKDLGFVADIGAHAGAALPLTNAAREMFAALAKEGRADAPDARVIDVYRAIASPSAARRPARAVPALRPCPPRGG